MTVVGTKAGKRSFLKTTDLQMREIIETTEKTGLMRMDRQVGLKVMKLW
jgi:hypothetical protein